MDPVEAGDWLSSRPKQLIFLSGLDRVNKTSHAALANIFGSRTSDRPPLNIRLISGELDLPPKINKTHTKGILRRDWPVKYIDKVPALIVLFLDLDWDHTSWIEKKTEAESKCASIRASCLHGSRLAVVLLQERSLPNPADDPLATERAHELCQICQLTPKQLFVLPVLGDLHGYVTKLETAFHELAQGFYQQKLKAIRARSIPNNSAYLVVRQLFKLAFLSELRQDTHTALRNYRLAYEQCKDNIDQWEAIDIFEWRSIVGLLNYKMCELCFFHNTAVEAINQMRKHQSIFFSINPGVYPTQQLASIEQQLWKAKQCWHFAQLFEQAVVWGLSALATLNPGTHLDMAATMYSSVNKDIAELKQTNPPSAPYPNPDPLSQTTIFFGQRPWRVGYDGLAPANIEQDAINAILHQLVVNHEGVISLLTAAMGQFKKYNCSRMQRKVMSEMADVYYTGMNPSKALQLWALVMREGVPPVVRSVILHKAIWAAYTMASVKDYVWCAIQLISHMPSLPSVEAGLLAVLRSQAPQAPFPTSDVTEEHLNGYRDKWNQTLADRQFFTVQASRLETFLSIQTTFLRTESVHPSEKVIVRVCIRSSASHPITLSCVRLHIDILNRRRTSDEGSLYHLEKKNIILIPQSSTSFYMMLQLKADIVVEGQKLKVSRVVLELGDVHSKMFGQLEFDSTAINKETEQGGILPPITNSLILAASLAGIVSEENIVVNCLVAEVASTNLHLRNITGKRIDNVRLEFSHKEQTSTEARALLFVDDKNELRSDLTINVSQSMQSNQMVVVPLRFSAQLVGKFDLILETSYNEESVEGRRSCKVNLPIEANEPFKVESTVLSINGLPLASLLNHSQHILKVDIESNANIVINNVDWLLADVMTHVDTEAPIKHVEDELSDGDTISYCRVVMIETNEEDIETPIGRLAVEWKRLGSDSCVRSVVALSRLPILHCPIAISTCIFNSPAQVRQPIGLQYTIYSHHNQTIELTVLFDLTDAFMFCGNKKTTFRLLPNSERKLRVVVMALAAGRLTFPRPQLRSPQIADNSLQNCLRTLPATLFILPLGKETTSTV